jgi:hypothetical protein
VRVRACACGRHTNVHIYTYLHPCTHAQHTLTQKSISTRIRMHTRETEGRTNRETNKKQEGKGERLCVEKTKRERYGECTPQKNIPFFIAVPFTKLKLWH